MKNDNENNINQDEEDKQGGESGSTGQGGATGEVRFRYRDAMSTGPRDDERSPSEIKRLLDVLDDRQLELVKKQKDKRKDRKAVKEGRVSLSAANSGLRSGGGRSSPYKDHPTLVNKAQFNGMDPQMVPLVNKNNADTNQENRKENRLENRLQNQLRHQNVPKFNPTPRPR